MKKGIILDFDGVIAQSMELHAEAYRRVLKPFKIEFTDREIFLLEGATSEEIIEHLLEEHDHEAKTDEVKRLADEKQATYQKLGPPRLYPGAEALVRGLREATPRLGLVTGTRRENLTKYLGALAPLFDFTLAAGEYQRGKPDPEPYTRTAQGLGLPPPMCAALENAPRGVQSAKAAGCSFIVALTTTVKGSELEAAGCDIVVPGHEEAQERLERWLRAA